MLKLGSIVTDRATGIKGTITNRETEIGGNRMVYIQPKALNKETGEPAPGVWVNEARIDGDEHHAVFLPADVLGSIVTDTVTGFRGMAIGLVEHMNGCLHVVIQPEGTNKEGKAITSSNFDIRRLEGKAIKKPNAAPPTPKAKPPGGPGPHYTR